MHRYIRPLAMTALGMASLTGAARSAPAAIELRIDGTAPFTAQCTLTGHDGTSEAIALNAAPPFARAFDGRHLRCAIELTGPGDLRVALTGHGNRSVSRTSGLGSRIVLAQGG